MKNLIQTRRRDVSFRRSGLISISAHVAKALNITPGDTINVVEDGANYYFSVTHRSGSGSFTPRFTATVWSAKRGSRYLRAHSKPLCEAMLDVCRIDGAVVHIPVGYPIPEQGDMLPLITRLGFN